MGWAKYYEDNMSICIGRMAVMDKTGPCIREENPIVKEKKDVNRKVKQESNIFSKIVTRPNTQGGRRGIELSFNKMPEKALLRRLQMNGWWWSQANSCWCNMNTSANRNYVRIIVRNMEVQVALEA